MDDISQWGVALFHTYGGVFEDVALVYARVAPVCMLLPFLSDRVLGGGVLRQSIIFLIALALWPSMQAALPDSAASLTELAGWIAREGAIGASMGLVLALPFWICMGVGELIDNQRGATLSEVLEPAHGIEVSSFGALMSVFATAAFLANDGMRSVLETLHRSYSVFGQPGDSAVDWIAYARFLDVLSREALRLSAPVVAAMFLTEAVLGVLSRFATQMGVFALAFSIKSIVAFIVFVLYFGSSLPQLFDTQGHVMQLLHGMR